MEANNTIRIFNGATAIVTGGASGIGRALAEELAKRGCDVALADLQIELAENVASEISASGGKAKAVKIDVTDFSAMEQLVQDTVARTGRLDFIFNNAGIMIADTFKRVSMEDWNQIIGVNLRGVINGAKAAYPIMIEQGFGHIINTASIGAFFVTTGTLPYNTTKWAVLGLSQGLRAEAARLGIRVSVLCPGFVGTPILGAPKYGRFSSEYLLEIRRMLKKITPMSPNLLAVKVLKAIAKNKAVIIIPSFWKIFWWIDSLSPSLAILLAQKASQDREKRP